MKSKKAVVMMSIMAWNVLVVIWIGANIVGCTKKKEVVINLSPPEETITEKKADNPIKVKKNYGDEYEMVFFDYNKVSIDHNALMAITRNAEILKDNTKQIVIGGHCDERGSDEYNIALGEKRANNVHDCYKYLGIDVSRISVISYGEEKPYDFRHNEKAWARNRRVETVLKK